MAKSLFLSKIQDRAYKHLVDQYIGDPSHGFEEVAQVFLDKYERLSVNKPSVTTWHSNNTSTNKSQGTTLTPDMLKPWRTNWKLPKNQWLALNHKPKEKLFKIRKDEDPNYVPYKARNQNNDNSVPNSTPSHVPQSNYNLAQMHTLVAQLNNMLQQAPTQVNNVNKSGSTQVNTPNV